MNEFARFVHDCDQCKFLGPFGDADLYMHPAPAISVIARFSDEGSDYTSGLALVRHSPALAEALRRAIERGFLSAREILK